MSKNQCLGKIPYLNQEIAERVLSTYQKTGLKLTKAYECTICKRWHLTSQKLRSNA